YRQAGMVFPYLLGHFHAIEMGHNEITNHNLDLGPTLLVDGQTIMTIGRLQYFISQILEKLRHGASGSTLIFHQQHGFSSSGQMAALLLDFTLRSYFLQRKRDLEAASLPYFAPDFYIPFVLHYDAVDG